MDPSHQTFLPLLTVFVLLDQSDSFVTQLPLCGRYNGNFSVRHDKKHYKGKVGKTVKNVTMKECALHCTTYLGCLFFNHKKDGTVCELMTSHKRKMTTQYGWQLVTTDYTDVHRRGPWCQYIGDGVCQTLGQHCEDSCAAPGFECVNGDNIARGKPVTASSHRYSYTTPNRAVDGTNRYRWASAAEVQPWMMVDLKERRYVASCLWNSVGNSDNWSRMKQTMIKIGHNSAALDNPVCVDGVDHSYTFSLMYYCTKGPMWGRYVVMTRAPGPVVQMWVAEIHIFVLDVV